MDMWATLNWNIDSILMEIQSQEQTKVPLTKEQAPLFPILAGSSLQPANTVTLTGLHVEQKFHKDLHTYNRLYFKYLQWHFHYTH